MGCKWQDVGLERGTDFRTVSLILQRSKPHMQTPWGTDSGPGSSSARTSVSELSPAGRARAPGAGRPLPTPLTARPVGCAAATPPADGGGAPSGPAGCPQPRRWRAPGAGQGQGPGPGPGRGLESAARGEVLPASTLRCSWLFV